VKFIIDPTNTAHVNYHLYWFFYLCFTVSSHQYFIKLI